MLFLDLYKAFDSLEHGFILQTFTKFGFGEFFFVKLSKHKNNSSSIKLKFGTSPRFKVAVLEKAVQFLCIYV